MTSLYDQFHSQKNINHMYNLINDLIQERIGKSIKDDMQYFTYYNNKLREIFIESEETDLIGLNKELLGHHLKYFIEELKDSKESNIQANNHILNTPRVEEPKKEIQDDSNSDVMSQFNEYIQQRDIPQRNIPQKDIPSDNKKKEVSFDDMINDMNVSKESNIKPIIQELVIQEPVIQEPIIKEEPIKETVTFTSANRIDIESNRFDYRVKCEKKINKLEKLIIPIEQSIHFAIPILNLKIKEFGLDTNIYLKDTYKLNNYTYGIYEPDDSVKINSDIQKELTIEILSIYDDSKYNNDILECKIEEDIVILDDVEDFKINDIVSINSKEFVKIVEIEEGKLKLENKPEVIDNIPEVIDNIPEVIDNIPEVEEKDKIYIMNMNLQNTLVFY